MKHDINKILQNMEIPEPDEAARNTTIKAALHEFNRQKFSTKRNFKGIKNERRLTGVLQIFSSFFGGRFMKRPFVIASGITGFLAILGFGISYYTLDKKELSNEITLLQEEIKPSEIVVAQNDFTREKMAKIDLETDSISITETKALKQNISPDKQDKASALKSDLVERAESVEKKRELKPYFESISGKYKSSRGSRQEHLSLDSVDEKLPQKMKGEAIGAITSVLGDYRSIEYKETGRDQFDAITTNPVKLVSEEPVSTFSIDVDTSSYAFIRRQLNHGKLPQKNAVRVEEMINYFDYDYPVSPDKSKPFQPTIAIFPTPWNENTKLLHIGIKGYDIISEKKPKANLVFLIDVSGSMNSHDKLPLLKNSLRMFINSLDAEDTVAIVVYAGSAGTVLEPTMINEKGKIFEALDQLEAGGSTAGGEGIEKAYAMAEANFDKDSVNRVILATDGDFNVGIRDPEELKSFVERKRLTGIFLSVLGFGQGNYNDALMQKLAQNGNGNAAYIDNLNEARKVLVDEVSSTLFPIAKDVKIQVEFNPKLVAEYRLIGYESRMLKREDFNNDKVDAGEIGFGHSVTVIYEITQVNSKGKLIDDLRYSREKGEKTDNNMFDQEYAFLKIRYKLPDSDHSQLINTPISTENEYKQLDEVPADFRFAASVAAFGQTLRGGTYIGEFSYDNVIKLTESAMGKDKFGYRHEFVNLVRLAKSIK